MTDRRNGTRIGPAAHDALETRLVELARHLDFPATPQIRDEVMRGVRSSTAPRWRLALAAVAFVALLGAIGAAIGFGVGGLRFAPAPSLPPLPSGIVAERGLGERLSLDAARERLAFEPRLPAALGAPDDVYVADPPDGGVLTLVWRDDDGAVDLLVTELLAGIGPDTFEKIVIEGTVVEPTTVGDSPAWWVGGGSHPFFYRDASGAIVHTTVRLAEPTLFWEEEGLTTRIEGAADLEDARRIAASLR